MILHIACARCGRELGTHVISKKEVTIEVQPCLLCIHREAKSHDPTAEIVAAKDEAEHSQRSLFSHDSGAGVEMSRQE